MVASDADAVVRVPRNRDALRAAATDAAGADAAVAAVGPTGVGALDPLVTASADGRTACYVDPATELVGEVAAALADGAVGETGDPDAVVDHDAGAADFPATALPGLDVGSRRLLAGTGWRRPTAPDDHEAAGGFVDADVERVLDRADDLRGRGWGDWRRDEPVGPDWRGVRDGDAGTDATGDGGADPAVVVNAHGGAADSLLLESVPFEPLEGADLAARAVGASEVVVYASEADESAVETARAAVDAYPDPAAPMRVATGPPVYRAAEPTMALEAIEGNDRLEARLRRPDALPTLHGRPALVHSARTLGHLALTVRDGDPTRTRLVTVAGDVDAPATVELAASGTLADALDAVDGDGEMRAAAVGGRFGGLTRSLDVAADPESLAAADLGTDGRVEVLGEGRCVLEFVGKRTRFAADANCGRCVPCREGSTQLAELLRDVYDGDYDGVGVRELTRVMDGSSVCAFGVDAARPARTAVSNFADELAAHADGRCPAGACFDGAGATDDAAGATDDAADATDDGAETTEAAEQSTTDATHPEVPQ